MSDIYRTQTNHTYQQAAPSLPTAENKKGVQGIESLLSALQVHCACSCRWICLDGMCWGWGECSESFTDQRSYMLLKITLGQYLPWWSHTSHLQSLCSLQEGKKKKRLSSFCLITCCFYRIQTLPAIAATAHKLGLLSCTIPSYLLVLFTV